MGTTRISIRSHLEFIYYNLMIEKLFTMLAILYWTRWAGILPSSVLDTTIRTAYINQQYILSYMAFVYHFTFVCRIGIGSIVETVQQDEMNCVHTLLPAK